MKKNPTASLLKISDLAKATNTNVSTIKFYVKEGLIQPACKTGPNMAYYSADCINRVQLIKSLQKEHYYPLSVIKRTLEHSDSQIEIKLLDAIHKVDYASSGKAFSLTEVLKMTRLTREQISCLLKHRLVNPEMTGNRKHYADGDLQTMLLIRRRMDAGIPFAESVASFLIYEQALRAAAKADVDLFIKQALMEVTPTATEAVRMICVSDETLDGFISVKRAELNRVYGSERLNDLFRFSTSFSAMVQEIAQALDDRGAAELAERCRTAPQLYPTGNDAVSIALGHCHRMSNSLTESLATSIALCSWIHAYFLELRPEETEGIDAVLLYSLRLCWLGLAPALLDCSKDAHEAWDGFAAFAAERLGPASAAYVEQINSAITRTGGMI